MWVLFGRSLLVEWLAIRVSVWLVGSVRVRVEVVRVDVGCRDVGVLQAAGPVELVDPSGVLGIGDDTAGGGNAQRSVVLNGVRVLASPAGGEDLCVNLADFFRVS